MGSVVLQLLFTTCRCRQREQNGFRINGLRLCFYDNINTVYEWCRHGTFLKSSVFQLKAAAQKRRRAPKTDAGSEAFPRGSADAGAEKDLQPAGTILGTVYFL